MKPARTTPPRSTTPVADYLDTATRPGVSVDGRYVVLPRVVLEQLPLPLQQKVTQLLAEVHHVLARVPWPQGYRVGALQWRPVEEMVESELRELGVVAELNTDGDLVHRDENGRRLTASDLEKPSPVSCPDPLYQQPARG